MALKRIIYLIFTCDAGCLAVSLFAISDLIESQAAFTLTLILLALKAITLARTGIPLKDSNG